MAIACLLPKMQQLPLHSSRAWHLSRDLVVDFLCHDFYAMINFEISLSRVINLTRSETRLPVSAWHCLDIPMTIPKNIFF